MWQTEIGNYGSFFVLLPSPSQKPKKSELLKNEKKNDGDIIIHKCTKNHNHMRYSSWDTEWNRKNFVLFGHFLPFYPLSTGKVKIKKKWNQHLQMSSFYTHAPKITIIWCMLPEIWNTPNVYFCHFGPFFVLLPHYWPQK